MSALTTFLMANKEAISAAHDVIVGLAALMGGVWVILRLIQERTDEEALTIEVSSASLPFGSEHLAFFDVRLRNVGKTKVQANPNRRNRSFVYDDGVEKLQYSGSLQVRRLEPPPISGQTDQTLLSDREIDWFERDTRLRAIPGLGEINLFSAYEDPRRDNRVDFWMEPGEEYGLGASVVLPPGIYLVKVTFIASGSDLNFWTRVVRTCIGPVTSTPVTDRYPI